MIHPDDVAELQEIATDLGGEHLRGAVSYPSETGSWQVGETDIGEWLDHFRGQEIVLIAVPIGESTPVRVTCGICGYAYDTLAPCPRCERLTQEEAGRQEMDDLLGDIEDFLASED